MSTASGPPLASPHPVRMASLQLALRILLGAGIVWFLVHRLGHRDPLWAMISVVIVSDRELDAAMTAFRARALHTVIGCVFGLAFLYIMGPETWSILFAMAASVLVATSLAPTVIAWRITPVTVAIVMMPGVLQGSRVAGTPIAIARTLDVLLGSVVAVAVSWFSYVSNRAYVHSRA